MPTYDDLYQQSLAHGYTPEQIQQYLQSIQDSGMLTRPLGLAAGALVRGGEAAQAYPLGWAGQIPELWGGQPWWTPQDIMAGEQRFMGAVPGLNALGGVGTDPRYIPGMGAYPELERLGTAALQGIAAAPVGAAVGGLPAAAAGSMAAERVHEIAPGSTVAPIVAGLVAGGGVGAAGSLGAGVARALERPEAVISGQEALDNALGALQPVGKPPTLTQAGQAVKDYFGGIKDNLANVALGEDLDTPLGTVGTNMTQRDIQTYTKPQLRPLEAAKKLLKDSTLAPIVADENPELMKNLGAAQLNKTGISGFKGLPDEVQEAIVPWPKIRNDLSVAEEPTAAAARMVHAPGVAGLMIGDAAGALASHLGLIPGGDVVGAAMGGLVGSAGEAALRAVTHGVARGILDPWLYGAAGGGTVAGAGATQFVPSPSAGQETGLQAPIAR